MFSCSDNSSISLVGKKFVYAPRTVKDSNGNYLYWVMTFTTSTNVKQDVRIGSSTGDYYTSPTLSTYKLSYPELTVTEDDGSIFTYTFTSKLSFKLDTNNSVYNQE
jgi:hypothetical protein